MTDIVFLDIECLGLDPAAPVWEFAGIRRDSDGDEEPLQFLIKHDPGHWLTELPEQFADDYRARYIAPDAVGEKSAAFMVNLITRDAVVVGCNPSFDTERLTRLLQRHGLTPGWHYRPLCVTTMAAGWLHGVAAREIDAAAEWGETPDPELVNRQLPVPWSSDQLSKAIGVDPANYPRHTAMGDVEWAAAQWDIITGTGVGS